MSIDIFPVKQQVTETGICAVSHKLQHPLTCPHNMNWNDKCSVGLVQLDSIQMIIPSHKPKITISQAPSALKQVITSVTSTHVRHCISSRPQGYLSIGAHQPGDWNWSRLLQAGHGKSWVANVVDDFPMFSHVFLHLKMDLANLKQL